MSSLTARVHLVCDTASTESDSKGERVLPVVSSSSASRELLANETDPTLPSAPPNLCIISITVLLRMV